MKTIAWIIFTLLVCLGWAVGFFHFSQQQPLSSGEWQLRTYLAITYVGAASLTAIAAYSLLLILFWRLLRLVFSLGERISADFQLMLVSLGIACFLIPDGVTQLARDFATILWFPFRLVEESSNNLFLTWQQNIHSCTEPSALPNCIGQLGLGFLSAWASSLTKTYSSGNSLFTEWGSIALFFSVWTFSALCLRVALLPAEGDRESALLARFRSLTPARRKNILFFALLAIAGYLSVAAVATIPGLQESASTSTDTSVQVLKEELDKSLKSSDPSPDQTAVSAPTDPFAQLKKALKDSSDSADKTGVVSTLAIVRTIAKERISSIEQQRTNLQLARAGLIKFIASDRQAAEGQAIKTYTVVNLNRKGSKETNEHYLLITRWFDQRVALLNTQLEQCSAKMAALDAACGTWAQNVQSVLTSSAPINLQSAPINLQLVVFDNDALYDAETACRLDTSQLPPVPDRPALGADLGPFRFVASWLLRMESMPLALIVGLMGFCLFGSACSTFVRERRAAPAGDGQDRPLVNDLTSVVIKGVSAAVVVFLAVEGGLAAFSNPNAAPNPYVLLLTCLVGAVYSERVWEWARENLGKNLASGKPDKQPERPKPDQAAKEAKAEKETKDAKPGNSSEDPNQTRKPDNQ